MYIQHFFSLSLLLNHESFQSRTNGILKESRQQRFFQYIISRGYGTCSFSLLWRRNYSSPSKAKDQEKHIAFGRRMWGKKKVITAKFWTQNKNNSTIIFKPHSMKPFFRVLRTHPTAVSFTNLYICKYNKRIWATLCNEIIWKTQKI